MSGYVTVNRLSRVQLRCEERKQEAHIKKIGEMRSRHGLDNGQPAYFPRVIHHVVNLKGRQRDIDRENNTKLVKLIDIMKSKPNPPPLSPLRRTNPPHYHSSLALPKPTTQHIDRISTIKGKYNVQKWRQEFEEHKKHLKISKNNKLFTPRDISTNRNSLGIRKTPTKKQSNATSSAVTFNNSLNNSDGF